VSATVVDLLSAIESRASALKLMEPGPTRAHLEQIMRACMRAPDHGRLRPCRFVVLEGAAREKLGNGGSVQHGRVLFAQPGKLLRIEGALGPLQEMAVSGVLTFTLAPDAGGTRISMSYRVSGALTMDSAKLAPLVDSVMTQQLQRLRDFTATK
jgi:nitroreductase